MTNNVNNVGTNSVWQAILDRILSQKTEQKPVVADVTPTITTDSQDEDVALNVSELKFGGVTDVHKTGDVTCEVTLNDKGEKVYTYHYFSSGKTISYEYHEDGTQTKTVKDKDGNIIETKNLDKDGKEIKDSGETPKVADGEKGSVEYIKNLMGEDFFNGEIVTNEQGFVTSIYKRGNPNLNGPGSYDFEIKIEYNNDGSITIKKYKYGFDGNELRSTRKFDKDGKEIKDSGETPASTNETAQKIADMFNKTFSENNIERIDLSKYDIEVSEDGKTIKLNGKYKNNEDGTMTIMRNNYTMTLNDDGSYSVAVSRNDCGSAPYEKTFNKDGKLIKEHINNSASLGPGGYDLTKEYNEDESITETKVYNSPDRNNNVKTEIKTTNKDGSYEITTKDVDGNVIETKKFDKDGKEIKDSGETPKVAEGEKGSIEYLNKILNTNIELNKLGGYKPEYDNQGRIISLNLITVDESTGIATPLAGRNYAISYNDDGSMTITSQMNVAGAEDLIVQKFDKDGKEIKDSGETPEPGETPAETKKVEDGKTGSMSWLKKLIGSDAVKYFDPIQYDSEGRITQLKLDRTALKSTDLNIADDYLTITYQSDGSVSIKGNAAMDKTYSDDEVKVAAGEKTEEESGSGTTSETESTILTALKKLLGLDTSKSFVDSIKSRITSFLESLISIFKGKS